MAVRVATAARASRPAFCCSLFSPPWHSLRLSLLPASFEQFQAPSRSCSSEPVVMQDKRDRDEALTGIGPLPTDANPKLCADSLRSAIEEMRRVREEMDMWMLKSVEMDEMPGMMERRMQMVEEDYARVEGDLLVTELTVQLLRVRYPGSSVRRPKLCDLPPKAWKVEALLKLDQSRLRRALENYQNVGEAVSVLLETDLCSSAGPQDESDYRYLCDQDVEDVFLHLKEFEEVGKLSLLESRADAGFLFFILRRAKILKALVFGKPRLVNLTCQLLAVFKQDLGLPHDASWEKNFASCKEFLQLVCDTNSLRVHYSQELATEFDRFEREDTLSQHSKNMKLEPVVAIEVCFRKCKASGIVTPEVKEDEDYGDCYTILENACRIVQKWKEHKQWQYRR